MANPLVSVIVLSYNHEKHISSAIESVIRQSYHPIELIVIDDASTDDSIHVIDSLKQKYDFRFIKNQRNMGNCKTFNKAFYQSKGKYIIDLAGDDLLMDDRVELGVKDLEEKPEEYGVNFCDVELINEDGKSNGTHYPRNEKGELLNSVPEGWIFHHMVERYFISTPSMLIKRKVLEELNGYDESLTYEDFDFWIRSSRLFKYSFTNEILVQKRILKGSLSQQQKRFFNKHLQSTFKVCQKALALSKSNIEYKALLKRINYELKWAVITGNFHTAIRYVSMYFHVNKRLKQVSS